MKDLTHRELVGRRLWLILLLFNMLVCAYSRQVGWILFWAIVLSNCVYEYGCEHGKAEERLSSPSDQGCGVVAVNQ
jgi:hypothetical protein